MQSTRLIRRRPHVHQTDLCSAFCSLYLTARGLSTTQAHHAAGGSNNATPNPVHSAPPGTTKRAISKQKFDPTRTMTGAKPGYIQMSAAERAAVNKERADKVLAQQQQTARQGPARGGLAQGNIFEEQEIASSDLDTSRDEDEGIVRGDLALSKRSPNNMAPRLDPNPNARARWSRMMVIRNIRRRGRLTREMRIRRTERSHLSRSRFFETSMKKLAPLARQIAGKTLDQAILQMRFSKKKAAREVHKHLIQARDEAIVNRGMGLGSQTSSEAGKLVEATVNPKIHTLGAIAGVLAREKAMEAKKDLTRKKDSDAKLIVDKNLAKHTRLLQSHIKALENEDASGVPSAKAQESDNTTSSEIVDPSNKAPFQRSLIGSGSGPAAPSRSTDIYIAEAWINRGPYEKEASPRARGRTDVLRHPYTGLSVLLKEEKTRTREKREKEIKAIRKRLNGKLWMQMPDRPIVRQSQYVLW